MMLPRNVLYDSAQPFFDASGSGVMRLSAVAAIDVCRAAASRGFVIARVEGGVWHFPGFEARLDCIWDGADPPIDAPNAAANNQAAEAFIQAARGRHDVFVITAPPLSGWPHRGS